MKGILSLNTIWLGKMQITTVQFVCVIIILIMLYTRSVKVMYKVRISITRAIRVVDNPKEIHLISSSQQLQFEVQYFWSLVFLTPL